MRLGIIIYVIGLIAVWIVLCPAWNFSQEAKSTISCIACLVAGIGLGIIFTGDHVEKLIAARLEQQMNDIRDGK